MPRTPNYDFERKERERQKALKKAEKAAAKKEAKGQRVDDGAQPSASGVDSPAE